MDFSIWEGLTNVEKPVRYMDTEWNREDKDLSAVEVSLALAFPDTYEIGMSHLGFKILYHLVNKQDLYAAERFFSPWVDREAELRKRGEKLRSLESGRALCEFDVVGFSLQYELAYTNVLNMLNLGGIPLKAANRQGLPIVVAGGPNTVNPEPLADFVDCFFIGEGEEAVLQLLAVINQGKKQNRTRSQILAVVKDLPGFYVPAYYTQEEVGGFICPRPQAGAPKKIKRRVIADINKVYYPEQMIVPNTEVIHDRVTLEIARGCTRGCRFCQAGVIYRPVREREPRLLQRLADRLLQSTGYDELSLLSLSTTDYSCIENLVVSLTDKYRQVGIGIALPSLRVDAFSVGLARRVQEVRKTGLTFAPEAGSQRLRDVINKGIQEEELLETVRAAFQAGWWSIKLYFMIGLPTEMISDVEGIVELAHKVRRMGKGVAPRPPQVTVSVSTFIPKPHTPFQWAPLLNKKEIEKRQSILKKGLKGRGFKLQTSRWEASFLEALFARGDRRWGKVIECAWQRGCRFDAWDDQLRFHIWQEIIQKADLPFADLVFKELQLDQDLPWDHIDTGVRKGFLEKEWVKAKNGELTQDCRQGTCTGCGCCENLELKMMVIGGD